MKYVLFNLLEDGTPTTRFARELVLAIDKVGKPIRVLPLGHTKIGDDIFFISQDFFEERYKKIVSLMWGPLVPGKEMYVFGDIKEVVQRVLRKDECAPLNYAFVTLAGWDSPAERLTLSRGLMNYDRVFVFSEEDQRSLESMGVTCDVVGDVSNYIDIEASVDEGPEVGRLLVVVPADGEQSEAFVDSVKAAINTELGENDAVWAVELGKQEWNMSLARNLGIRRALKDGFEYVAFQDLDVETPPGYYTQAKKLLAESPDNVIVPTYVGEPTGKTGPASGNIALHVEKALEVEGYDENYVGGGSEDIDFLFRLERDTVCFKVRPDTAPLKHYDHAPRGDREFYDKINEARVSRVMNYEDLETKSILKDIKR